MKRILSIVGYIALVLGVLDLVVLMFMTLSLAVGEYIPHIPFWDSQLLFVANLFN